MPKSTLCGRLPLFFVIVLLCLVGSGNTCILGCRPGNDELPHSLQLLTLLQQQPDTGAKLKAVRHSDKSELRAVKGGYWTAGLEAFRKSDMHKAAEDFSRVLSDNASLSPQDRAAAAFWAYRAFVAEGDQESAALYLGIASQQPPGLYSILARYVGGAGEVAEAGNVHTDVVSQYPMPKWIPASGYKVEPALLFAIMRQESEFDPGATSAKGAMGVMQLMPATAKAMARNMKLTGSVQEPAISMALGQQYLQQLMGYQNIQNNMLFLLSAYNAGPAVLEKWQKNNSYNNDPLLFLESIPYGTTRDYVVNVMGNYWVYSELFGNSGHESVAMISGGGWPLYKEESGQVVDARN